MMMDQDFPEKVTHCSRSHYQYISNGLLIADTSFSFSIAQWSVEEDDTIMSKVATGEGKTHGKNGKTGK